MIFSSNCLRFVGGLFYRVTVVFRVENKIFSLFNFKIGELFLSVFRVFRKVFEFCDFFFVFVSIIVVYLFLNYYYVLVFNLYKMLEEMKVDFYLWLRKRIRSFLVLRRLEGSSFFKRS